jgi:anti-sigma regulatory factor (Ser/Thr protein kinase)
LPIPVISSSCSTAAEKGLISSSILASCGDVAGEGVDAAQHGGAEEGVVVVEVTGQCLTELGHLAAHPAVGPRGSMFASEAAQASASGGRDIRGGRVSDADRGAAARRRGTQVIERSFHAGQLHGIRELAAGFAQRCGASERAKDALLLVASELVVNAVRHGGGCGRMRLWRDRDAMWCQIADDGPGFADPRQADGQVGPLGRGGRGLWIVRTVADGLSIDTGEAGTTATAAVALPG